VFWVAYPLKVGKGAALKAWQKATGRAPVDVIIEGARRYAADPNREPAFTKHPATWLNAHCWSDDPLPRRTHAGRPTIEDGLVNLAYLYNQTAAEQDQSWTQQQALSAEAQPLGIEA